jgi:Fur family transcriptional regulator, ferric uptake regulator
MKHSNRLGAARGGQVPRSALARVREVSKASELDALAIDRAMQRLRQHLQQSGGRWSDVRELIAKAALRFKGHFTVDDLLAQLPRVHAATAYRVLPVLIESGLIEPAPGPGDSQRYERAFERNEHDHLMCTSCGLVIEFNDPTLAKLMRVVAERFDFKMDLPVQQLLGVCSKCRLLSGRTRPPFRRSH